MEKKPKVLVLSSVALHIGPAIIAEDYYKALNANGVDCDLMLLEEDPNHPEYLYIKKERTKEDLAKFKKMRGQVGWNKVPFFYKYEWNPIISSQDVVNAINKQYDVVYTVFWQEGFSYQTMKAIYDKLHCLMIWGCVDYSTMAGGCHFVGDCERYKVGCGCCTAFGSKHWYDFTRINTWYRKWVLKKIKPIILMNRYMESFYRQSYLWKDYDRYRISKSAIINTDVFRPLDKHESRNKYNIDADHKVILFGCQNIQDERKGVVYLISAFQILESLLTEEEKKHLTIVGIGNSTKEIADKIALNYIPIPYLPMTELPALYSLADCFVCPSVNDAGPMMVNQALCCGTPVVGFDMGAVQTVVKDQGTGYCVDLKNSKALAESICKLFHLSYEEYHNMQLRCREVALETSSFNQFAKSIVEIYKQYS